MHHGSPFDNPALTIALALMAGTLCQGLSHHLRLPSIVLLLGAGALLGPDLLNVVRPDSMGDAMRLLVGFAVAVILFEGGMNLKLKRIRAEQVVIRRLITWGALVTGVCATGAAHWIMGWSWSISVLFGTLVIVTGPTVITPLVRRIRLRRSLETVLEAEGVLIDPIGAILAVVALEVVLGPSRATFLEGFLDVLIRIGLGGVLGLAAGFLTAWLLKPAGLVPEGLENIFSLSAVLALFHGSDALAPESGIAAVTVAGVVMGNVKTRVRAELHEFKEQLTLMLIGMLFVLLSADVRFSEIQALGVPGLILTGVLMVVIRPLNVLAGTVKTAISWRERFFLFWMAPRGIVAAAVASFFAVRLQQEGIPGGSELRAMVFLVIAATVLIQGLSGGLLSRVLKVNREGRRGHLILGANPLAVETGLLLQEAGEEVTLIDSNPDSVNAASDAGLKVVFGNALEDRNLARAQADGFTTALALTPNEEVNLIFANKMRKDFKVPTVMVALHLAKGQVSPDMVEKAGGTLMFGMLRDIDNWSVRLQRGTAAAELWERREKTSSKYYAEPGSPDNTAKATLPLLAHKKGRVSVVDDRTIFGEGDRVTVLVDLQRDSDAKNWLRARGWAPVTVEETA